MNLGIFTLVVWFLVHGGSSLTRAKAAAVYLQGDFQGFSAIEAINAVHGSLPGNIYAEKKGKKGTLDYRVFLKSEGHKLSPWHQISLYDKNKGAFTFVCEIPKETTPKLEMSKEDVDNPIRQDLRGKKLRYYGSPIHWNYGFIPQTWEDPERQSTDLATLGDNDPVDVVEIGGRVRATGDVIQVKPLCALALIDGGQTDWKIVVLASDDPRAVLLNGPQDLDRHYPGELERIRLWFRDYKIAEGGATNTFGYEGRCLPLDETLEVIALAHDDYLALKSGSRGNPWGFYLGKK